jgi:hypothetical protein
VLAEALMADVLVLLDPMRPSVVGGVSLQFYLDCRGARSPGEGTQDTSFGHLKNENSRNYSKFTEIFRFIDLISYFHC